MKARAAVGARARARVRSRARAAGGRSLRSTRAHMGGERGDRAAPADEPVATPRRRLSLRGRAETHGRAFDKGAGGERRGTAHDRHRALALLRPPLRSRVVACSCQGSHLFLTPGTHLFGERGVVACPINARPIFRVDRRGLDRDNGTDPYVGARCHRCFHRVIRDPRTQGRLRRIALVRVREG